MSERMHMQDEANAMVTRGLRDVLQFHGKYDVIFRNKYGEIFRRDVAYNTITTVGKNKIFDTFFAGSAYTAAVYMGLKGTGSAAAGDTQASHAGWLEVGGTNAPAYTGNRQSPSWSAASGGAKSMSAGLTFAFTSSGTVYGCFLNVGGSATKDDTTATLVSIADFSGGSQGVGNGDSITVTWSISA